MMSGKKAFRNGSSFVLILNGKASCLFALAIAFLTLATPAQAQFPPGNTSFELVPIGSTGPVTSLVGNAIVIPAGGVVVELELRIFGWATTGDGGLLVAQAAIDGSGYCSGIGDPLYPVGYPSAPVTACPQGSGCPLDGATCDQGGFVTVKRCSAVPEGDLSGQSCGSDPECPAGMTCEDSPDYIFAGYDPIAGSGYPGLNYEIFGVSQEFPGKPDATCVGGSLDGFGCLPGSICPGGTCTGPPRSWQFGTLLLAIPPGAVGTYNISFSADTERTFMADGLAESYAVVNLNGATITVSSGACCSNFGGVGIECRHNVTAAFCDSLPQPTNYNPGEECPPLGLGNLGPDFGNGCECVQCLTDSVCNDNNDCTDDSCGSGPCGGCGNIPNYNTATDCCNPIGGSLTPIDDFDVCTTDFCNASTGEVNNSAAAAAGLSCDDGLACSVNDECDGISSEANGGCSGEDVNSIACPNGISDCPLGECDAGFCSCHEGCTTQADCEDNEACTDNICDLGTGECSNPSRFDAVTQCCDSATGVVVTFGDGDPCTDDFCDAITFEVTHTPIPGCMNANNRYVTFFPNRGVDAVNYLVTETTSGRQKWLLPPTTVDELANSIARLTDTMPALRVWDSTALYIGDCIVAPGFTYDIRSTTDGTNFSTPVLVDSANVPSDGRNWADCVGAFNTSTGNWGPPDGLLTAADILAVVQAFQLSLNSVPVTWADLSPERPNGLVNSSDILDVVLAFQFAPYPHSMPMDCP